MHTKRLLTYQPGPDEGFKCLGDKPNKTADLSTTLRSGRDDNFVAAKISYFSWTSQILSFNRIVISTGAQRSGEICGFPFGFHAGTLGSEALGVDDF
jgi:hypothetical protein